MAVAGDDGVIVLDASVVGDRVVGARVVKKASREAVWRWSVLM